jgi:hypothetical protein
MSSAHDPLEDKKMNEARKQRMIREALGTADPRLAKDFAIAPLALALTILMAASFVSYGDDSFRTASASHIQATQN